MTLLISRENAIARDHLSYFHYTMYRDLTGKKVPVKFAVRPYLAEFIILFHRSETLTPRKETRSVEIAFDDALHNYLIKTEAAEDLFLSNLFRSFIIHNFLFHIGEARYLIHIRQDFKSIN